MTINEMIQALEDVRDEHGGEIECVFELTNARGFDVVPVGELSTAKREITYDIASRRGSFAKMEKCTMFLF